MMKNIEVDSIWVRDGKKYKVQYVGALKAEGFMIFPNCVCIISIISNGATRLQMLFQRDFLKDFTPYKSEYKYQYAFKSRGMFGGAYDQITAHISDEEAADLRAKYPEACHVKIEASKIEV